MLSHNITVPVELNVVSRWMRKAGFKYDAYKKCYYVDRHEAADVIADRNKYLRKFFEDEVREKSWVQMPLSEFHLLMKKERKAGEAVDEDVRNFIADKEHMYLASGERG